MKSGPTLKGCTHIPRLRIADSRPSVMVVLPDPVMGAEIMQPFTMLEYTLTRRGARLWARSMTARFLFRFGMLRTFKRKTRGHRPRPQFARTDVVIKTIAWTE